MPRKAVNTRKAARRRARNARAAALLGLLVAVAGLALAGAAASTEGTDPVGTGALVDPVTTTIPEPTITTATDGTTNNGTDERGGGVNGPAAGPQASAAAEPDVVAQDTPPSGSGSIAVTKNTVPTFGAGSFTFTLAWSGAACNGGVPGSTQVTLTTPPSGATHTFTNLQTTGCTWTLTETVPTGWVVQSVNCSGGVSNTDANPSTIVLGNGPPPGQLAANCTFTNTASPSITVTKQTENDLPGTFTFTLSGGQGAGTSPPLSDGQSFTFTGLAFNTAYTLTENIPAGWTLAAGDIVCDGGNPNGGTATTNGKVLTLNSGNPASRNNAQCTFTNRTRSIRVTKQTNPDGSAQTFTLQLRDGMGNPIGAPQTVGDGQTATWVALAQGTFQVTEAVPTGWDLATAPCTGASANSAITNGRSITLGDTTNNDAVCTYTNTQRGQIVVTKDTDPEGNSGTFPVTLAGPNAFSETGNLVDDGGQHTFLAPPGTPYNLTENLTGLPYTLDSITCARGATTLNPASFTVNVADSITCTVTNDANPGTVTVTKDTDPEGGTGPFPVTLGGPNAFSQTKNLAGDGSSDSFTNVPADSPYNLTEDLTGLPYTLDSITCMNGQTVLNPASFRVLPGASIAMRREQRRQAGEGGGHQGHRPRRQLGELPGDADRAQHIQRERERSSTTVASTPSTRCRPAAGYALGENLTGLPYSLTSIVCNGTDVTQGTFNVGPDQTVNCTVTNGANPGTVTVTKDTDPEGGTGPFPVTLGGPNAFSQTKNLAGDGSSDSFTNVPADSPYNLTEDLTGLPYTLDSITCMNGQTVLNPASFRVLPGASIQCAVNNDAKPGKVVVTKDTDPEGNSGSFPVTLTGPNTYSANGTLVDDGGQHTFDPVPVGSGYALGENLAGLPYELTSIVCNGTDVTQATFNVGPNETVNCTVTNTATAGSVIVAKHTDPAGGTGTFPVTLSGPSSFSASGNLVDDGSKHTFSEVPAASGYALSENTSGLDYTLESIICGGVDVTSGNFAVARDQTVECTVTNVRNAAPPNPDNGGGSGGGGASGTPGPPQLVTGRPTAGLAFTGSSILIPLAIAGLALFMLGGGLLILRARLRRV